MIHPVYVVDVDSLFLFNLIVTLIWLWGTSRITGVAQPFWRLLVGAVLGSVLAVALQMPIGAPLRGIVSVIFGTALVLGAAFLSRRTAQFVKTVCAFLLFGGVQAAVGMALALRRGAPAGRMVDDMLAVAGMALVGVAAGSLVQLVRRRGAVSRSLRRVEIDLAGKSVQVEALLDTGNHLQDPLTQTPAMVVEVGALGNLLPDWAVQRCRTGRQGLEGIPPEWLPKFRLLPYRGMGGNSGVLIGLVPDRVTVFHKGNSSIHQVVVAFTPSPLDPNGLYRALLPAALADSGVVEDQDLRRAHKVETHEEGMIG